MLSLRGKIAVMMTVAFEALAWHTSRRALSPWVMSSTCSASPDSVPTLLIPASTTITFGFTPSSSRFSRRQRIFSIRSAPQPKLAAFHPKKLVLQFSSTGAHGGWGWSVLDKPVCPGDKMLHVRSVLMAAIVLAPRQLTVKQTRVHRRHPGGSIVFLLANIARSEQPKHRPG